MNSQVLTLPKTSTKSFNPVWLQTLKSAYHFIRSLRYLQYRTTAEGAVYITHVTTGSCVAYRADGNIDFEVTRNMQIGTGNRLLLNCNSNMDLEDASK